MPYSDCETVKGNKDINQNSEGQPHHLYHLQPPGNLKTT